jgi:hypothetical protein
MRIQQRPPYAIARHRTELTAARDVKRVVAVGASARSIARWVGVGLAALSVAFATLSYVGFWNYLRGDDLLSALGSRLDTSYAPVSRQVRATDPEWVPLLRVIRAYSPVRHQLPKDREPVVFARFAAVSSAKSEVGEWTAPTTPMALLYKKWPAPGTPPLVPGQDAWIIGTLGDFHEWMRKDEADFDFFWRTVIFGSLSACIGVFLALPDRRPPAALASDGEGEPVARGMGGDNRGTDRTGEKG